MHSMNKLLVLHKFAVQFDRVIGPRHPWLTLVGAAMHRILPVKAALESLGYHLATTEADIVAVARRNAIRARGRASDD